MTKMQARPPERAYTDDEIEIALTVLAAVNGRPAKAATILADQHDLEVHPDVLRYWRFMDPQRSEQYTRIMQDIAPRINRLLAEHHQALALDATEVGTQALQRTAEALEKSELDAKDLSVVAKNMATVAGIHTDKHQVLTGQPSTITGHLNLNEIASSLASLGVEVEIDGEVVEIEGED